MLFRDFQHIVRLLEQCVQLQKGSEGYINPYLFNTHNELITALLEQVYNKDAIEYILNEWLCGNTTPIMLKTNEGVEVEIPVKSLQQLWKAMETYGTNKVQKSSPKSV